jgi:hypothetical protein
MFSTLLYIAIISFLIRWYLNWGILNKVNNTRFVFGSVNSFDNYFAMVKHMIISQWTLFWFNREKSWKKQVSNMLSIIMVLCLAAMFFVGSD